MKFQREGLADIRAELEPLMYAHYKEIAHYQDIELDPAWDAYFEIEKIGAMRMYTARHSSTGELIGYCVFFVRPNMHYKNSVQAAQDVLFIKSTERGTGVKFILWCDKQLAAEGVQVVYHHVKAEHDFGKMLKRIGYKLVDLIYARRLD